MRLLDQFGNPLSGSAPVLSTLPEPGANAGDCAPGSAGQLQNCGNGSSGYEGAQNSALRTSFPGFPTNTRKEISAFTRKQLVRKQRALDANLGIFSRIKSKIGQHSVGRGVFVRPLTRDKDWNELNRRRFEAKAENPLLYSTEESFDFYEDQRFAAETMVGDGEYFAALAWRDGTGFDDGATPCVQRLDVFEIESPWGLNSVPIPGGNGLWQDGVRTNFLDAARAFGVRELPRSQAGLFAFGMFPALGANVREVPADGMIHVFRQRRAHQVRDLTWFYSGINNGIDTLDLVALEKHTAKLHSALGLAVRKKKGEAGKSGLAGEITKAFGVGGGAPAQLQENFWSGAAIAYLAEDEGIDLLKSDRPSPNLLAFIEFLYREIAIAIGLPLEVVYKMADLGGATARAALEDAQWLFDCVQDKIVMRHSRRFYVWDTAIAMERDEIPVCKDPEWWASCWRGPAKLTVDLGRTADAAVKLMKNAALSHVRYYEERAQDPYAEMETEIVFRQWLKKRCLEAGVEYSELIEPTPGSQTNVHVAAPEPAA